MIKKVFQRIFQCQKGQSLIEVMIAIPMITATVAGLLFSLYYTFSFFQVRLNLQEALLCLHNKQNVQICQTEFSENLSRLLPIGDIEKVLLQRNSFKISGLVIFNLIDDFKLDEFQELHLPLIDWNLRGDI